MFTPLVVLKRDPRLDTLSLDPVFAASKFPKVCLTRNTKLDNLASSHHQECASNNPKTSGRPGHRKRRRKRQRLAKSFKPDLSLPTIVGQAVETSSDLHTWEDPILDINCMQALSSALQSDVSLQTPVGQAVDKSPCEDGRELHPPSVETPYRHTPNYKELSKENFLALLHLWPTHVAAKFRKCTLHRTSKYLHINKRNLWDSICRYHDDLRVVESAKRPSCVLLERNTLIDLLAHQSVPSIHLDCIKFDSRGRHLSRRKSLVVVVERDPGLDQLSLRTDKDNMKSSRENVGATAPCESLSQPDKEIGQASQKPGRKRLYVKISKDKRALHAVESMLDPNPPWSVETNTDRVLEEQLCKNVSIQIKRDHNLDKRALLSFNSSVSDDTTVCNHQSNIALHSETSSTSAEGQKERLETQLKRDCKAKRQFSNFKGQADREISGTAVIKMRKTAGRWSIIRPHLEQTTSGSFQHQNAIGCQSGSESSSSKGSPSLSTQLKKTTCTGESMRHSSSCQIRLPTPVECNIDVPESLSLDSHLAGDHLHQSDVNRQRHPVLRSSVRKISQGMVTCSVSSRTAKSVTSDSSRRHNENKNPQTRFIKPSQKAKIVMSTGSRETRGFIDSSHNGSRSKSADGRSGGRVHSKQTSISDHMTVKKPLTVKSEYNVSGASSQSK